MDGVKTASKTALMKVDNLAAATQHYISHCSREGRSDDNFDPAAYLNNYADLQAALGSDLAAATQHYVQFGFAEGRTGA